ncbi:MAG: class I SAM-dependent methyltransferase [Solirubrobacteraceae bacterium]|nr:class I SAM-dependent methyltransferase [Solirubrobacteraceae bacterium]
MLDALPTPLPGPMLDIGPHTGELTMEIARHVGIHDVHGVELIADHIPAARKRGVQVVHGDVDRGLPFPDESFGFILANQVIEHVRRTDTFLREIRRVVKPDGVVCISTNNLSSWHNVISLALGMQPTPMHVSDEVIVGNPMNPEKGMAHEDLGRTHLRLFTRRALAELAQYHGLETVKSETVGYYPLPPRLAQPLVRMDQAHGAFIVALFRPSAAASTIADVPKGISATGLATTVMPEPAAPPQPQRPAIEPS